MNSQVDRATFFAIATTFSSHIYIHVGQKCLLNHGFRRANYIQYSDAKKENA